MTKDLNATHIAEWAMDVAVSINNQFKLGLSDREMKSLGYVIDRRASKAYKKTRGCTHARLLSRLAKTFTA